MEREVLMTEVVDLGVGQCPLLCQNSILRKEMLKAGLAAIAL